MPQVEYKSFSTRRNFGVEFEVGPEWDRELIAAFIEENSHRETIISAKGNGWAQTLENDYWHVKYDSTCGPKGRPYDHGWEIASYIASGFRDSIHIANVASTLEQVGVSVNNNCGLHIHVDADDFTPSQMAVLVARWMKIEPVMANIVPLHRLTNPHCRLLRNKKSSWKVSSPSSFWKVIRPNNLSIHDNPQKKMALNLVNYTKSKKYADYHRPTVEFRLPEGTLNGEDVKNWIRLFVTFVETSRYATMPKNVNPASLQMALNILGLRHSRRFYILSKGMYKTKVWFLQRIRRYGRSEKLKRAMEAELLNLICEDKEAAIAAKLQL